LEILKNGPLKSKPVPFGGIGNPMNNIYQSFVNGQHGISDVPWKLREDFQPLKD
jgi:hypothetical protein